LGGHSVP